MKKEIPIIGYEITLNDHPNMEKVGLSIFCSGCNFHCKNCHNPESWDVKNGTMTSINDIKKVIKEKSVLIKYVAFLGGEPTLYNDIIIELAEYSKKLGLETVLYTGSTVGYLSYLLVKSMDIIVDGKYCDDLKTGRFPASSNQNVYFGNHKLDEEEILKLSVNKQLGGIKI